MYVDLTASNSLRSMLMAAVIVLSLCVFSSLYPDVHIFIKGNRESKNEW